MNKGIVLFAHNNRQVDYALMSIIAGGLAKKHLSVPVSLITDDSTVEWLKECDKYSVAESVFDKIIITERPVTANTRNLNDGNLKNVVPFNNSNRNTVWNLTPYERTLLIDSDFFIMSNTLSSYWEVDSDLLISSSMNDIVSEKRTGYFDRYVSETGVKLYWATTVMFTKNDKTKAFFELVDFIRENYSMFADIYRFSPDQYRNDISFSVAKHIFYGFEQVRSYDLPPINTVLDKDMLVGVDVAKGKLDFLLSENLDNNYIAASVKDMDVHLMNKQSITRNAEKLMELI